MMGFAKDLRKKFQYLAHCGESDFYEIELVTKLQDSLLELAKMYPSFCHSEIIHGARSGVEFDEKSHWVSGVGPTCKKELADILFVVYSKRKRIVRICFMQNKRADRGTTEWFSADLLQLDLLHNRSVFTVEAEGKKKTNTILNHSKEASVTVYGLFYKTGETYDMDFYAASGLRPKKGSGRSRERLVVFDRTAAIAASMSAYSDEVRLNGLEGFVQALIRCRVGRVISMDDTRDLDALRGIAELHIYPEEIKKDITRSIENLEVQIGRLSMENNNLNEYVDLNIGNQIFFIDADEMDKKENQLC